MEISDLPDKELKIMLVNMLTKLIKRMEEHYENLNNEMGGKVQSELKNIITETRNTPEGINSRLDDAEGQISNLKGRP